MDPITTIVVFIICGAAAMLGRTELTRAANDIVPLPGPVLRPEKKQVSW